MGMTCERTKDINVLQISCRDSDRHLPPQRSAIEAMKRSLSTVGQITPISVYPITRNTYRVITGATRFRAAAELRWKTIRASIWSGSVIEYQLHELVENAERRELTGKQRREMRMKIKQLQAEKLASIEPSKGGRGKKGGVSEAAREEGISRRTAVGRRQPANKGAQNDDVPAQVCDAPTSPPPQPVGSTFVHKVACSVTEEKFRAWQAWCEEGQINIAEGLREAMDWALETKPRKAGPKLRRVV